MSTLPLLMQMIVCHKIICNVYIKLSLRVVRIFQYVQLQKYGIQEKAKESSYLAVGFLILLSCSRILQISKKGRGFTDIVVER